MIKPKSHPELTAAERADQDERIRRVQASAHPGHRPWAACQLAAGDDCPTCGEGITELSVEPLEFEVHDGVMLSSTMVCVALPCGHASVQTTGALG